MTYMNTWTAKDSSDKSIVNGEIKVFPFFVYENSYVREYGQIKSYRIK